MREFCALLGLRQKFSGPLRPCEMGKTERLHQESQKVLGLLVHDVCKARPHEWSELLGVVEFILDTTPGPSGVAPRDFERGWSLASPLERELIGRECWEFEPIEESTKRLFQSYREVRVKVLGWQAASSAQRAERANRFRKVKVVEIGDLVVYRDPRLRSGGRTPWRKQLSEPLRIVAKQGNRVDLETPENPAEAQAKPRRITGVHVEDLLLVPPDAADPSIERPIVTFQEDPERDLATRSPGMMIEQRDSPDADAKGIVKPRHSKRTLKGKLASLREGSYIAYAIESIKANVPENKHLKRCRVGRIRQIRAVEQVVVVHRHTPVTDGNLRVKWKPLYLTEEAREETLQPTSLPVEEEVPLQRIITEVQLLSGVISHAAARRIDASGYKVDERRSAALQKEINLMHIAESQDLAGTAMLEHASFIFAVVDHPREEAERKENDLAAEIGCSELEAKLMRAHEKAKAKWDKASLEENWEEVRADMSAYRYSGERLTEDPRRNDDYRKAVVKGLGFDQESRESKPWLNDQEYSACAEVLQRKAAAFWVPGSPRTAIRHVQHDTITTGPPVKTPPHRLSPEAAEWIDQKIEEEIARGQLIRGNSPWGSPPFPTREAAAHKRARKRRIVVDYRRVNARVLRNSYYSRKASEVIAEAAGSAYLTLLDAVTGFNQVENTDRAKQVLALVSRGGQFLPTCLTFGPQNGPEDFAYVVDRIYAPGRHRKLRLMKQWLPYVDDLTIRTGRVLDGVVYRDEEMTARVRAAIDTSNVQEQQIGEAMEACGFATKGLGIETSRRPAAGPPAPVEQESSKKATQRGSSRSHQVSTPVGNQQRNSVMGSTEVIGLTPNSPKALEEPAVAAVVLRTCWEVRGFECDSVAVFRSRSAARASGAAVLKSRTGVLSSDEDSEEEEAKKKELKPSDPGRGRMSRRGELMSDPVGLGRRLTSLLRHGRGVTDVELRKYMSVAGWVSFDIVRLWLKAPNTADFSVAMERAVDHPETSDRLEIGTPPSHSHPDKKFVRARHSWSVPWVTEGLPECDPVREPEELYHGTLKKSWLGILRSGLLSEQELLGRRGRLHVHLVRGRDQVKQGSEILIKVRVSTLFQLADEKGAKVFANEKAVYVEFGIPSSRFPEFRCGLGNWAGYSRSGTKPS